MYFRTIVALWGPVWAMLACSLTPVGAVARPARRLLATYP
jgi:hypothetical protein